MRTKGLTFLLIIAMLIAACGGGAKRATRQSIAPASILPSGAHALTPLPVRPLSPKLEAVRQHVMRETATLRGLDWKTDAGMIELSGWEYGTRTKEMADALGGDELRALSRLAIAGGMLPEGIDLATLAASFTAASAGATYSPLDKQVLLLTAEHSKDDPSNNNSLLTHEFTHALQDQHFDLLKLLLVRPYNFDRTETLFSIVEGDAMNVQRRLEQGEFAWSHRSLEDIERAEDARFTEYRKEIGAFFPPLLTETFIFRYRDGVRFVEAIRRKSGERGVDELFIHPPASSEQVLHPEKYFSNEQPREVHVDEQRFAGSGWGITASTPLGEIGTRGLLLKVLPAREAARAAAGWNGDRAYLFESSKHAPLFVWKSVWEKSEDAVEFFNAYNTLCRSTSDQDGGLSGPTQTAWREAGRLTLVQRSADTVIILRGADADVQSALQLTK